MFRLIAGIACMAAGAVLLWRVDRQPKKSGNILGIYKNIEKSQVMIHITPRPNTCEKLSVQQRHDGVYVIDDIEYVTNVVEAYCGICLLLTGTLATYIRVLEFFDTRRY